jgi:F-type H+-transporting ATPase subunit a
MEITPDSRILFVLPGGPLGDLSVSATIVNTWIVMAILVIGGRIATLGIGPATPTSHWRLAVELLIEMIRNQIRAIGGGDPSRYLPFVGTLFLFTLVSNVLGVVPGFISPTGSLSTAVALLSTAVALALCVLVAVPMYGIAETGLFNYLRRYIRPTPLMAPFNVIGEISRTIALAVRLYGNVMSGMVVAAILLSVAPFFFPVLLQLLGLLTGVIQAYIFAVLAMVYIVSASGVIAAVSIVTAGLTIALGSIGPALGEARAAAQALQAIAQQPDEANTITRTLFVSLAMIESTAIYCFVVAMILLFANPFWDWAIEAASRTTGN